MVKEFTWKLDAKVVATYTDPDGNTYANVIEEVHWRCTCSEGDLSAEIYGSLVLPKPTNPETYIDLDQIVGEGVTPEQRSATILGWVGAIQPGFKDATEAKLAERVDAMAAAPAETTVSIL